jgi:dUTPase
MSDLPEFKFCILSEVFDALESQAAFDNDESLLAPEDFLPIRAEPLATGWDVRCAEPGGLSLEPEQYIKIPLGIKVFSPSGWWLRLAPRSSTMVKRHIHALYGVIDEGYENQMYFCGQFIPDSHQIVNRNKPPRIEFGDRIGQLIPVRREEMSVISVTPEEFDQLSQERDADRKAGGFGSTGGFIKYGTTESTKNS